jgi:predicted RNase H-like HicB family nuclease
MPIPDLETMNFAVIYEKTSTGYSAYVPDLPGCVAGGATFKETAELIRGAIGIHLESMHEDGDSIPEPTIFAGCVAVPT